VVVPVDSPVKLVAFPAEGNLCEAVIAGEDAFLSGWAGVNYAPSDNLRLYLHEQLFRDDGLMVVLYIVLRHRTVVLDPFLGKKVRGVGFLQQGVSDVLFVSQNLVDGAAVPLRSPGSRENAVCFKPGGNLIHAGAFEVFPVNAFHNLCLLRVDDQMTF